IAVAACGIAGAAEPAKPPMAADDAQDLVLLAEGRPLLIRAHVRVDGQPYRAAWDTYVERVFKFLDANGDGVLDKTEIERMPPTPLLVGGGGQVRYGLGGPSERLTPNSEGKATREEFARFLRRVGASAFQIQVGGGGLGP